MTSERSDYIIKIIMIGNSGVGKSNILLKYAENLFSESYVATIGIDFRIKSIIVDNKKVKRRIVLFIRSNETVK